jgi:lysophospholipase L1-like esterase
MALIVVFGLASGARSSEPEFPGDAERKAKMTADELAWEELLEKSLGRFYLPRYKQMKAKGLETAWDYVKDDPKLPRILLIGDSISRGYTLPVRHALAGKANVHRAPENCGKSINGLEKLDIWLGEREWDLVHFNFGIHDRKLKPEDYADRIEMIVGRLEQTGAKLIWASSTPIPPDAEFYEHGSSDRLNKIASQVMRRRGIPINDLYSLILPDLKRYQNPRDCHFNLQGYQRLGGKVAEKILAVLNDKGKPAAQQGADSPADREAVLFSDDFDRAELGGVWHVARGECSIRNNRLCLKGPATVTCKLAPDGQASCRDLRVEYQGRSDEPCDISLLLNVTRTGELESGYFFGFGSQWNTLNKLVAFGAELCRANEPKIQPGKTHRVTAEKTGTLIRMLIDGKEVLRADGQRLYGSGSLGFYVWTSAEIDNVKVYALPEERRNRE